jgi:hypothetical protein
MKAVIINPASAYFIPRPNAIGIKMAIKFKEKFVNP